jgi:hypothetical protein
MPSHKSIVVVLPNELKAEIVILEKKIAELRSKLQVYGGLDQARIDRDAAMAEVVRLKREAEDQQAAMDDRRSAWAKDEANVKESWRVFEEKAKQSICEHDEQCQARLLAAREELKQDQLRVAGEASEIAGKWNALDAESAKLLSAQDAQKRREEQYALSVVALQKREQDIAQREDNVSGAREGIVNAKKILSGERETFAMEVTEHNERRRVAALEAEQYAIKKAQADERIKKAEDLAARVAFAKERVEKEIVSSREVADRLFKEQQEHDAMKCNLREESDRLTRMGAELIQRESRIKQGERQVELAKQEARQMYTAAFDAHARVLRGEAPREDAAFNQG